MRGAEEGKETLVCRERGSAGSESGCLAAPSKQAERKVERREGRGLWVWSYTGGQQGGPLEWRAGQHGAGEQPRQGGSSTTQGNGTLTAPRAAVPRQTQPPLPRLPPLQCPVAARHLKGERGCCYYL